MKISVMGLGYVGAVAAGCLAQDGHEVIGVDPQQTKVDLINAGKSPIIEKDIGEIIAEQVKLGRLARDDRRAGRGRGDRHVADLRGHAQPRQRRTST